MVMDYAQYEAGPEAFKAWRLWHQSPVTDPQDNFSIDWASIQQHVLEHNDLIPDTALNLGVLLIDEGQDFPEDFYRLLRTIAAIGESRRPNVSHPLCCFVLADENQQITERNSTLGQIEKALAIKKENCYLLIDNFRNTKEIALLAGGFYADVSAVPLIPARAGEKPTYECVATLDTAVSRIKAWINNNPGKETCVLVFNDVKRDAVFNRLKDALLTQGRKRKTVVQTYSWKSRKDNPIDKLAFDAPDHVTVLNVQSCKGLEFDSVFILDLHDAPVGLYGTDRFKMQMFVAVSRGRDWVSLVDVGSKAGHGPYWGCIPGEELLERATSDRSSPASPGEKVSVATGSAPVSLPVARSAKSSASSWEEQAMDIASCRKLKMEDNRKKGGAFWITGGQELASLLRPLGFEFTPRKNAWWRS